MNALPRIAKKQFEYFARYVAWYLRRNFHAVRILNLASLQATEDTPLLICLNHPGWWDPLIAIYLSQRFFAGRNHYGPIAAAGVAKYKFFERLGFFAIDPGTPSGAARFLRIGEAVLGRNDCALWVTPQGEFADVRKRPVEIANGVGHLARRSGPFVMMPIALEYAFWTERYPEAFVCMGEPVSVNAGAENTTKQWTEIFRSALVKTQDELALRVQQRDPAAFQILLGGRAGVGGVYDAWRRLSARLRGKNFRPEHGRI